MFVVEQAHWYYEDFCRDADPGLPSLSLRVFAHALAAHCPDAFAAAFGRNSGQGQQNQYQQQTALIHDIDAAMAQFNAFKAQVPTAGAALLDPTLTKVLMVKGYKKDASWGFPRGKLSKGETAAECAAREVLEETGIDVSIDAATCPRIEVSVGGQATTLFVVAGAASEDTPVAALVRGEIGDIAWHLLADLPATKEAGMLTYRTAAGVKHRFWRVRERESC
jgi:8-oxo-dGTP pyrophosphatase MutT (NUDIX family)